MQHVKLGELQQVCMRACNYNYIRCSLVIMSITGSEGDVLPDYWDSMIDPTTKKPGPLRVIDVAARSEEYKFVLTEFNKTMVQGTNYTAIVTIERIQNPALYEQYAAKKKHLDSHNPKDVKNERWLFHGTKEDSVSHINTTNFNRSLCGQNGKKVLIIYNSVLLKLFFVTATMFGRGCYFARDATYSNRDTYSVPNSRNEKRMYFVRVLTGEFTKGEEKMAVAPPKDPSEPTVLYDSVVNSTSSPTIFVVFYDGDAYPEYLITYTK